MNTPGSAATRRNADMDIDIVHGATPGELAGVEAAFAHCLLDAAAPPPPGLRSWNGADIGPRLAVYRNNVATSLANALADGFPVVARLVGRPFFDAMARAYGAAHPLRSPVLAEHGDTLAAFIEGFAPAAALPYLADVARLERLRVRATHAADAPALPHAAFAAALAQPHALPAARLQLHPSAGVCVARHAAVSLWAAHQRAELDDAVLQAMDWRQPEAALVLRQGDDQDDEVAVIPLPLPAAVFLCALLEGRSLGQALAGCSPAPDLPATLALLLRHRAITGWASN